MGEDEENDKEQEAMKRRERQLRRLGEEDGRRDKYEDCISVSSGSLRSRDSSPDSRGKRRSRSPRRSRWSRSPSPRVKSVKR